MSAPQIAAMARTDESHVRKVIHAFNEQGFESLDPDYRGGRPTKTTLEQRDRIVAVARARPDTAQGVPLTRWSLAKLSEHLAGLGIALCAETLRLTLRAAGLSHQRTRSWKWSPDPDFVPNRPAHDPPPPRGLPPRRRLPGHPGRRLRAAAALTPTAIADVDPFAAPTSSATPRTDQIDDHASRSPRRTTNSHPQRR